MRIVPMDDVAQNVMNLSNHLISSLSSTCRLDATNCSSSNLDTGIFAGIQNPANFLQNLCRRHRSTEDTEHLRPWFFAKIRRSFPVPKHERMTVKSRRVMGVNEKEVDGAINNDFRMLDSRVSDKTISETAPKEYPISKYNILKESPVDTSEETEMSSGAAVSKEELGRATWTFLHTLAAQFPDQPTKQQQNDVKVLMGILSRIYPCKECADHFKEVLKANPVEARTGVALGQWMCRAHNMVNRSLNKPQFDCNRVELRWGALDCNEGACDLHGRFHR